MKAAEIISTKINDIKDFCGLELKALDSSIKRKRGEKYFNVEIYGGARFSNPELHKIERLMGMFGIYKVEGNGANVIAIFFN